MKALQRSCPLAWLKVRCEAGAELPIVSVPVPRRSSAEGSTDAILQPAAGRFFHCSATQPFDRCLVARIHDSAAFVVHLQPSFTYSPCHQRPESNAQTITHITLTRMLSAPT